MRVSGRLCREVTALDAPAPAVEAPVETVHRTAPQEVIAGTITAAGGIQVPPATMVLAAVATIEAGVSMVAVAAGITAVVAAGSSAAVAAGISAAVVAETMAAVASVTTGGIVATGMNVSTVS